MKENGHEGKTNGNSKGTLVTVRQYADLSEARVAKSLLEQHGFVVILPDQHFVSVAWHAFFAIGGLRLQVPEQEAASAGELLAGIEEKGTDSTIDICPVCGSGNVFRHSSLLAGALGLVWGAIPLILKTKTRTCRRCGNRWKESVGEEEKTA